MTALSEPERLVREALVKAADTTWNGRLVEETACARDLVAALRPLLAADPSGLCTTCRDCGLCGAYGHLRCWLHADDGGDLELRDQLCPPADPEIVTGEQARELPEGSIAVLCHEDGTPIEWATTVTLKATHRSPSWTASQRVRVFHRAPAPAPKVGDVVRSEAELGRLPERSVVRSQVGAKNILERGVDGTWHNTKGARLDLGIISMSWLPARVLDLGGES